ncbi:glycosyltransferase family 4 protein [Mucilaginibacter agri]|uniref:Glycosyltransferase n=1 Tax=Mucilaginibacter agri TaxID=2695265 RepID=A0A965ZIK1_9SPHI|nr:glycosyltransferase family 1 protein [Mucilaginibacter agri]NCD70351.1 glycosyltransferase [Mucilaginibacter agri]
MKDLNRGYYSFGKGLGDALIRQNHGRFKLSFYVFKITEALFAGKVGIYLLSVWHKIFFSAGNKFDIVHFTDHTFRLKPQRVKALRIMTLHDMNKVHVKKSKPASIERYLNRMRKNMAYCDRVVTISQFVANDVLHYFPEVKDKLSVIYNGADKLVVPENHLPVFLPSQPFLYTIGLLSKQKGFHFLPALLVGNDYHLVIAGIETPHKQQIIEEAEKYNCMHRVHITGPVSDDDKAWYYKNCEAFLFPSIAEGFGLPVIEAMYFGKPVFLSKFTSLPEVGEDAAYYFDSFEPQHMQEVFAKGMHDFKVKNRANEMVIQAEKFSWDKAADQYLQLYHSCLQR